ncbi:MAG: hypothetical protein FWD93_06455 [Coriobacteriia bacterium]|nr:hypothetical protein [Coriobacteriia bacterium]
MSFTNDDVLGAIVEDDQKPKAKRSSRKKGAAATGNNKPVTVNVDHALWRAMKLKVALGTKGETTMADVMRNALEKHCAAELKEIYERRKG